MIIRMSEAVKDNIDLLKVLHNASPKLKKAIIDHCDKQLIDSITEIIYNILKDRVKLTGHQYHKLRKNKKELRLVASKHGPLKLKRELLSSKTSSQKGGWLGTVLAAALPLLLELFRPKQ